MTRLVERWPSPIGIIGIIVDGFGICQLGIESEHKPIVGVNNSLATAHEWQRQLIGQAIMQLEEYFEGKRTTFDLPLSESGSPFQKRVWAALRTIPYGATLTYGDLATLIQAPKAARAIGSACHHNPVSIVTPCHRVVGADGSLTGYASGVDVKAFLLEIENQVLGHDQRARRLTADELLEKVRVSYL